MTFQHQLNEGELWPSCGSDHAEGAGLLVALGLLEAREAMPNLFLKLEQVPFSMPKPPIIWIQKSRKPLLRSVSMTASWGPIQIQSTRRARVHMKVTMNSRTLMMKRNLTRKAVLVTLKKINQRLPDQTHLGNQDTPSDVWF